MAKHARIARLERRYKPAVIHAHVMLMDEELTDDAPCHFVVAGEPYDTTVGTFRLIFPEGVLHVYKIEHVDLPPQGAGLSAIFPRSPLCS